MDRAQNIPIFDFSREIQYRRGISDMIDALALQSGELAKEGEAFRTEWAKKGHDNERVYWEFIKYFWPSHFDVLVAKAAEFDQAPTWLRGEISRKTSKKRAQGKKTARDRKSSSEYIFGDVSQLFDPDDPPDPKHWADKNPDAAADVRWIFDNISNPKPDWRDAPSLGAYSWLLDVQRDEEARKHFRQYAFVKIIPGQKELDEQRRVRSDDGGDITATLDHLSKIKEEHPEWMLHVMGYVAQAGGVSHDA